MKIAKLALLIAMMLGALLHQSDGQQVRPLADQLRLAGVMPKGALLYIQARDLSALMKRWLASPQRKGFYDSPSFAAFSQSHLYLKLQTRKADFDKALGFSLDEDRLAELAGGTSAVSIYDIGKLELVFVTEVPRTRAVATTLFKSMPKFEERSSNGTPYYAHDVTSDGGRLNQEFCFSYINGRLIITTTEGLMIRALSAAADGSNSLLADVTATGQQAKGFTAHDVTLWVDQARLNKNQHFVNYWIYHNTAQANDASLANIQSGLMDLSLAADGMHERRWFVLKADDSARANAKPISGEEATALMRFVPSGVQMVQVHGRPGSSDDIGDAVSRALFGSLPDESATATGTANNASSSSDSSEEQRSDRYSSLDARFDMDVDDDSGASLSSAATANAAPPAGDATRRFAKNMGPFLSGISPDGYCEMIRSRIDQGKPFARFERAVVIEMKDGSSADRAALERLITEEFRARFVIAGIEPRIEWQDDSVRALAQSLLEQGAAYSVSGRYLILASSKEFARDILAAGSSAPSPASLKIADPVETYALIRIADAKPVFDALMAKLDGRSVDASAQKTDSDDKEEEDTSTESSDNKQGVKFFSDNVSSLIKALAIREVQLDRETSSSVMAERVNYIW